MYTLTKTLMDGVEALVFDVFGTVVDWRSSVEEELESLGKKYSIGATVSNNQRLTLALMLS